MHERKRKGGKVAGSSVELIPPLWLRALEGETDLAMKMGWKSRLTFQPSKGKDETCSLVCVEPLSRLWVRRGGEEGVGEHLSSVRASLDVAGDLFVLDDALR